tara:strand:- start:60 stop:1385 length:1326 start_codon:yes stop_codon:yes gene_type:complete
MGGGLMQLVAMGAQDVFLTGNPQITFFKAVYRRHTNFSKECIRQDLQGSTHSLTCTLSRNGDLVQEMYLCADITANFIGSGTGMINFGDFTNLIKTVEVEIGGQKIDKHYTAWLDIYNELFETNIDYVKSLNGADFSTKTESATNSVTDSTSVFIPLRFWFNRNPGLALPLIALQYHEVKVLIELNEISTLNNSFNIKDEAVTTITEKFGTSQLSQTDTGAIPTLVKSTTPLQHTVVDDGSGKKKYGASIELQCTITNKHLLVNYIYLDTDERRRFAQVSHEYLIEQVQHTGTDSGTNITLTYNHPVKALFWNNSTYTTSKLQLNGHDRFTEQTKKYFKLVQPHECGLGVHGKSMNITNLPELRRYGKLSEGNTTINEPTTSMYSFCLKPGEHQPSGTCNFSRIDNARLLLNGATTNTDVFAINYNVFRVMSGMGGLTYSN